MQRTLVLLKPDSVQRGLLGELISRIERRGLRLVAMKLIQVNETLARQHYSDHITKPFFPGLVKFITSGPLLAIVTEGENAVKIIRSLMGPTDPKDAPPGTIRGDFATSIGPNLIHGSDSVDSATREISLFFSPDEIISYTRDIEKWIIES